MVVSLRNIKICTYNMKSQRRRNRKGGEGDVLGDISTKASEVGTDLGNKASEVGTAISTKASEVGNNVSNSSVGQVTARVSSRMKDMYNSMYNKVFSSTPSSGGRPKTKSRKTKSLLKGLFGKVKKHDKMAENVLVLADGGQTKRYRRRRSIRQRR